MANVVAITGRAAMMELARWLRVGALFDCIVQRMAALFTRRVGAAWWTSVDALPAVRQQLLDPAVQLRGQPREHVLQVSPGLVPIELGIPAVPLERLQSGRHISEAAGRRRPQADI